MEKFTAFLLLAGLIFLAEMTVVSLSTVRIICLSRGRRKLAPVLGFFEILLWLFAIGQIMQNLTNPACYLAFAAGFTVGNYLGIVIEEKLALGMQLVRVITRKDASGLVQKLRQQGYGVTLVAGEGATGQVWIIFSVIPRRALANVVELVKQFDPHTFYSVDDLRTAAAGVVPRPNHAPIPRPHFLPSLAAARPEVPKLGTEM